MFSFPSFLLSVPRFLQSDYWAPHLRVPVLRQPPQQELAHYLQRQTRVSNPKFSCRQLPLLSSADFARPVFPNFLFAVCLQRKPSGLWTAVENKVRPVYSRKQF